MMDPGIIVLVGVIIAQFTLLWYKLGRCEQMIEDLVKRYDKNHGLNKGVKQCRTLSRTPQGKKRSSDA